MRGRHLSTWLPGQVRHIRSVGQRYGPLAAIGERLEALISRAPRWGVVLHRLAALEDRADAADASIRQGWAQADLLLADLHQRAEDDTERHGAQSSRVDVLDRRLHDLAEAIDTAPPASREDLALMMRQVLIESLWLTNAPLSWRPLVTVVIPTHLPARLELLLGAVESVVAQTYQQWELFVVDDSGLDRTDDLQERLPTDARISIMTSSGRPGSNPRNDALDLARGDVVAYLDDDCRFFPWWLHSAVRALTDAPDRDVVYGVRVVEPDQRGPSTIAEQADGLTEHLLNPVDTNTLVHRRRLEARWPAVGDAADDFNFLLGVDPSAVQFVPVPASTYATTSPDRFWGAERRDESERLFRESRRRARPRRPLRAVAHNALYPLMSETYIGDELEALRRCGVDIVMSRDEPACVPTESRVEAPLFESFAAAIEAHDPDLVLMHWADTALRSRSFCAELGIPYALRTHSFDGGRTAAELIDEWCIGVWTPPLVDLGHVAARPLSTLVVDPGAPGDDARRTGRVVCVAAGLPKKDWPTMLGAAANAGVALDLIVAHTNGYEHITDDIQTMIATYDRLEATLSVNMPYDRVQDAIRSASALVYNLTPEQHIGQPRSVLEGGLAATPLVVPDHATMYAMTHGVAMYFRRGDVGSLSEAIRHTVDRPPAEPLRLELAAQLREGHSSAEVFEAWTESLTAALVDWRRVSRTGRDLAMTFWSSELVARSWGEPQRHR